MDEGADSTNRNGKMMATQPKHHYSFLEYLDLEREASYRSEYRAGDIVAMAGGSQVHSALSARMIVLLSQHADGCQVYDANLRLYIEQYDESTYADAMLICGEPQFWQGQNDVITNPTVLVEVSSPSTRKYDRTTKSGYYRSIRSLRHIVLVSQDATAVEWSTRQDESTWITRQYASAVDLLPLGFGIEEIYRGILI